MPFSPRPVVALALVLGLPLASVACNKKTSFQNASSDPSRLEKAGVPTPGKDSDRVGESDGLGKGSGQGDPGDPGTSGTGDDPTTGPDGQDPTKSTGTALKGTPTPNPSGTNPDGTPDGSAGSGAGQGGGAEVGSGTLPSQDELDRGTEAVKAICEAAGAKVQTLSRSLTFPARTATCPFGTDAQKPDAAGNLAPGPQDRISARVEEVRSLDLPAGATLCELEFFTPDTTDASQKIKFNDEILLTFEGVIMASSFNYNTILLNRAPTAGEWVPYRWEPLRGFQFEQPPECERASSKFGCYQSTEKSVYCLGKDTGLGTCLIPKTESTNTIRIQFQPALTQRLSALSRSTGQARFGLVTLGDNDRTDANDAAPDCTHSAFTVKVEAKIVVP